MIVNDVSTIVNELYKELTGQKTIEAVDAKSIVDIGRELENSWGTETTYRKICDKVARQVFLNKGYQNQFNFLVKDSWEWGNIIETIRIKPLVAETDPSYHPENGKDYPLTVYNGVEVETRYYQKQDNFEIKYWKDNDQLWGAFQSESAFLRFINAIEIEAQNAIESRTEALCKTALNNFIAQTLYHDIPDGTYGTHSTLKAVNLLKEFKTIHPDSTVTAETCLSDPDFGKFATEKIMNMRDFITGQSVDFNIDGEVEYTKEPSIILLSVFANALKVNMQSGVFNKELVELPNYRTVPYWQGSNGYGFNGISEINLNIENPTTREPVNVNAHGIVGVLYDDAGVVVNREIKKTNAFNHPDLDRTLIIHKYLAGYMNIFSKNFIVFYVADAA